MMTTVRTTSKMSMTTVRTTNNMSMIIALFTKGNDNSENSNNNSYNNNTDTGNKNNDNNNNDVSLRLLVRPQLIQNFVAQDGLPFMIVTAPNRVAPLPIIKSRSKSKYLVLTGAA